MSVLRAREALARYRQEAGDDAFAPVSAECARMLAEALAGILNSRDGTAAVRARALLGEQHQPAEMHPDLLWRLVARYQAALLSLTRDDDPC